MTFYLLQKRVISSKFQIESLNIMIITRIFNNEYDIYLLNVTQFQQKTGTLNIIPKKMKNASQRKMH
jgi:hypothetical protein